MEASRLASLHEGLQKGKAERGSSGGLGFDAASAKVTKKKKLGSSKPSNAIAKKGEKDREFASTTAGAVAMGHWDPWARPVEFKMKQANKQVGSLYTMFVKGQTMGGTLKEDATTDGMHDSPKGRFKWKKEIKARLQKLDQPKRATKGLKKQVLAAAAEALGVSVSDKELKRTYKKMLTKALASKQ